MTTENGESDNREDQAIKRRLGRLQSMPVDTTRLDEALRSAIPRPRGQWLGWLRPGRAVVGRRSSWQISTGLPRGLPAARVGPRTQPSEAHRGLNGVPRVPEVSPGRLRRNVGS